MFPGVAAGAMPAGSGAPPPALPDWLPIPDVLAQNPMFTAGFGLVGMTALLQGARAASSTATAFAKKRFLTTLEVTSKDYS